MQTRPWTLLQALQLAKILLNATGALHGCQVCWPVKCACDYDSRSASCLVVIFMRGCNPNTPTAHLQPATQQIRNHIHLYIGIQTSCDGSTGRPTMHPSPWVLCPPFAYAYERYDVSLMACAICTGPVLLRRENIKNIDDLQIETWVNDVLVQVGNASGVKTRTGMPPSHARLT